MSFEPVYKDYIKDVSFEVSSTFFVPEVARLPPLPIQPPSFAFEYLFEAEKRAREDYEEDKKKKAAPPAPPPPDYKEPTADAVTSLSSNASTASLPVLANSTSQSAVQNGECMRSSLPSMVLLPSKAAEPTPAPPRVAQWPAAGATAPSAVPSFEEFESVGASVFDDIEVKSIDDRKALTQIWSVQLKPESTTVSFSKQDSPPRPPAPRAATEVGTAPTSGGPLSSISANAYRLPDHLERRAPGEKGSQQQQGAEENGEKVQQPPRPTTNTAAIALLESKLVTKGFRQPVVRLCLAQLPREKIPYIEYYIKAVSRLEKGGVPTGDSLSFLLTCELTDKQDILRYAETAGQLLGMGFAASQALPATKDAEGDRVKALDRCLSVG